MTDLQFEVPPSDYSEDHILGFSREAIQEAEAFLRHQIGYSKIEETIRMISGEDVLPQRKRLLSATRANEFARCANMIAAGITDMKPFFEYYAANPMYQQHVENYNKLATGWFNGPMAIDQKFNAVAKYAIAAGSGYAHMVWNTDMREIDVLPEHPLDVLPIRPASYESLQTAFGVIVRRERPVDFVKRQFPHKAAWIEADRDGSAVRVAEKTRFDRLMGVIRQSPASLHGIFGKSARDLAKSQIPVCDVFYFYMNDASTNDTGSAKEVGQWVTDPSTGKRIPAKFNNWSYIALPGEALYPRKRLIIFTRSAVLYDGPNIFWHGLFPVTKLTLDPWPWMWFGKSPMWDLIPLQHSLDRTLRAIDDHIARVLRPPVVADRTSVTEQEFRDFDPQMPGISVFRRPMGQGIEIKKVEPLDETVKEHRDWLVQRMGILSGTTDISGLLRLNQMPNAQSLEQILGAMTPDLRQRSRSVETFMSEFAMMYASNAAQFYGAKRRIQVLGPSGLTLEDFDVDPYTLVPAHTESDIDPKTGRVLADRLTNPRPRYDRSREFFRSVTFRTRPGSMLKQAAREDQMLTLQLARLGFVDKRTLLERMDIGNPDLIMQRLQQEQEQMAMMAAQVQMQSQMGGAIPPSMGGGGGGAPGAGGPGRPPAGEVPPRLKSDPQGNTTITESSQS